MPAVKKEELFQTKEPQPMEEEEESGSEEEYEVEKVIKHRGKGLVADLRSASAEEAVAAYWETQEKTATAPRKRGRQEASMVPQASITPKPESSKQAAKKARTSTTSNGIKDSKAPMGKGDGDDGASDDDIDRQYSGSLDKYNDLKSWENVVQSIETVEQGEGGQLIVYATMYVSR
ncbi:hypothetical protein I315_02626 [Cryptococcus gattii Ru294]|nr:hypothetical protein I315_02626 [Cryptococcus gattii Ru294]